jgi:hypothetical protein
LKGAGFKVKPVSDLIRRADVVILDGGGFYSKAGF